MENSFNVATEFTIPIQGRCLATTAWLMAQSPRKDQKWRSAAGHIVGIPAHPRAGVPITVLFTADGLQTGEAQTLWETKDHGTAYGARHIFTPSRSGTNWIEAEAVWPDGRRAFGMVEFEVAP